MQEIWKDIEGYEGYYQVSNKGNIRSLDRIIQKSDGVLMLLKGRMMTKRNSTDGYWLAKLSKNDRSKSIGIHILVARHFIPNPLGLPEVNHKDLNRKNNEATNLEWCTHLDNVRYSQVRGRYKGRTGEKNPNYNNHVLHERYANDPELAKRVLARKGKQNGRCIPVKIAMPDGTDRCFDYIGEAAEFLRIEGYTRSSVDYLREKISLAIKNDKCYLGLKFCKI